MGHVTQTFEFPAPLDKVWKLFVDPQRWSQWNKEWSEIRDVRGPFDHPGAGYTQVLRLFGRERLGRWEVVACQPQSWRRIAGTLPFGSAFRGEDRFEETGGVTRVTVEIEWETPWGWLGRALEWSARPLLRRQLKRNARTALRLLAEPDNSDGQADIENRAPGG